MRNNKVIILAGNRGRGKTDYTKEVIAKTPLPKALVVDTFDSLPWHTMKTHTHPEWESQKIGIITPDKFPYWKKGIYRMFSSDIEQMKSAIDKDVRNTFVVFEDATKYVGSRLTDAMRRFIYDTKQKNIDALFIFHSLAAIPPELVRVSDILTLFSTGDSLKKIKQKYDNPEVSQLMELVQEEAEKDHYFNASINLN